MKEFLDGLDRERIVRWTAIYLVIYVVVNACLGLVLGVVGALAAGVGAMSAATIGSASTDAAAASTSLTTIGSFSVVLAIFYILSVPICGVAAFGLFRRKAWARNAAVVALAFTVLISLISLSNGFTNILWAVVSLFGIYLFWSDPGIKQVLSN